jgi:hypothetical protein
MGRETHAGIVCVHLYLRASCWEERIGYLESAKKHLQASGRRHPSGDGDTSDEDTDVSDVEIVVPKIDIPVALPMGAGRCDLSVIRPIQILVNLQLEITKLMPQCPSSASLFGSIQSVSELIDYLLMDGHVGMAKKIIAEIRLPDSAICGIFNHS